MANCSLSIQPRRRGMARERGYDIAVLTSHWNRDGVKPHEKFLTIECIITAGNLGQLGLKRCAAGNRTRSKWH